MISDSTVLIVLGRIGKIDLLRQLFSSITIPSAVQKEVLVPGKEGNSVIEEAIGSWIQIADPEKEQDLGLGPGENAALLLAAELKKPIILDDAYAIKIAKGLSIEYMRTTSVVLLAYAKKIISKKEALSCLKEVIAAGYYISPEHYSALIERLHNS